jgi:hypothetical protein
MDVLSYVTHTSVAGTKDWLSKLRSFAIAQGWTSVEYQTSKTWASIGGGNYGWVAGNHDFLELNSAGYGSQTLRYRFRANYIDATDTSLYWGPIDPGYPAYSTTSSTSPEIQNNWETNASYRIISMPTSTFAQCWFFGNSHFIWCVLKVSTTEIISFGFGSPQLATEYQTTTEGQMKWSPCTNVNNGAVYKWNVMTANSGNWFSGLSWSPANGSGFCVWKNAAARYNNYYRVNIRIIRDDAQPHTGMFNMLPYAVCYNSFANQRPIFAPTVFFLNNSGLWEPVGTLPLGYCVFQGCGIGDTLEYANEDYLVFPNMLSTYKYGYAVRIA